MMVGTNWRGKHLMTSDLEIGRTLSVHRINPEPGPPYGFDLNPQETTAAEVYANTEEGEALLRKVAGRGDRPTTDKHGRTFVMLLLEEPAKGSRGVKGANSRRVSGRR
jgi:hypothetical protein